MNIGPSTSSPPPPPSSSSSSTATISHHHHQYGSNAPEMSRSTFPSSYYDPFYANTATSPWSAYPTPASYTTSTSQVVTAAAAAAAANNCIIGPNGPKHSLVNTHFSSVHHSQRRKRRVLFTQAQMMTILTGLTHILTHSIRIDHYQQHSNSLNEL
ncbi:homeobox protein Nkx-2.2-like protein [Euroglyphus maynei]|uniref:Homeobox protein Nkx-2.2-like protein n=1 Tax=Euroglyphus maynei TaxID=6958 RepID=A0A1Y3AS61_EURMA|nr:homeobox protein Nkx-2.2-like protein [Euroglyphus maynei]